MIGGFTAGAVTTGSGNVFIGYGSGGSGNVSNTLCIENSFNGTCLVAGDFSGRTTTINGGQTVTGSQTVNTNQTIVGTLNANGKFNLPANCAGSGTLVNSTTTISTACVTSANSRVMVTRTAAGVSGNIYVSAKAAGTFTVTSLGVTDTGTFDYVIFN